jgi:hypothetical protein
MIHRSDAWQDPTPLLGFIVDESGNVMEFGAHRDALEFMAQIMEEVQSFAKGYQEIFSSYQKDSHVSRLLQFDMNFLKGSFIELPGAQSKRLDLEKRNKDILELESILVNIMPDMSLRELIDSS